jgi:recombinational DNA repair protein (RecF pathway)
MTSEADDYSDGAMDREPCAVCGEKLSYPFLAWPREGGPGVFICSRCCKKIKTGFTADLVHVAAISELHDLGYHQTILKRTDRSTEAKDKKKQDEETNAATQRFLDEVRLRPDARRDRKIKSDQ